MDVEKARSFLREHHRGVLATTRVDGRPQMSVVSAGLDAEGRPAISTREDAFKVRNIRRDARVSLCVLSEDSSSWIQIDGSASVLSLPEAMDSLVDVYRSIAGEHPDWDDFRRAMEEQRRVVVRIDIERAGPDRHA